MFFTSKLISTNRSRRISFVGDLSGPDTPSHSSVSCEITDSERRGWSATRNKNDM